MKIVPTLKEVAMAAGVSMGTASQALRSTGKTARGTRERIRKIAEQMGYLPNPVVSALAAKRFKDRKREHLIPVVFVSTSLPQYAGSKLRYHDEIRDCLKRNGYAFRFERVATKADFVKASRRWYQQGVQGVIMSGIESKEWMVEAHLEYFSLVKVGARIYHPTVHTVMTDAFGGMELVLGKALDTGAKRIGFVIHQHKEGVRDDVLRRGMLAVYKNSSWKERLVKPHYTYFDEVDAEQRKAFEDWLEQEQPDLIIGHDIVQYMLLEAQCQNGKNIRFFGMSHHSHLKVPSVIEPTLRIATRAVEWLDSQIRRREYGIPEDPVCILVQPYWNEGTGSES